MRCICSHSTGTTGSGRTVFVHSNGTSAIVLCVCMHLWGHLRHCAWCYLHSTCTLALVVCFFPTRAHCSMRVAKHSDVVEHTHCVKLMWARSWQPKHCGVHLLALRWHHRQRVVSFCRLQWHPRHGAGYLFALPLVPPALWSGSAFTPFALWLRLSFRHRQRVVCELETLAVLWGTLNVLLRGHPCLHIPWLLKETTTAGWHKGQHASLGDRRPLAPHAQSACTPRAPQTVRYAFGATPLAPQVV